MEADGVPGWNSVDAVQRTSAAFQHTPTAGACRWIERSGVRNKRRVRWDAAAHAYCPAPDAAWPAHFGHPDAVRMQELVRRLHSIADAFATKYVRRAFAQ